MTPHRCAIKIYFADGITIDPSKMVPLFHEWIRNGSVDGLLIDVVDYSHVHEGPAAVLVGHETDYAIDLSEGRAGLQVTRKRPAREALERDLREGLQRVLAAARTLQQKADPHPPVRFRTDEIRVQAIDRLHFPHTPETLGTVRRAVESAWEPIFRAGRFEVTSATSDTRAPVTLRVTAPGAPGLGTLLSRLESSA
jgi:hypothetical protein